MATHPMRDLDDEPERQVSSQLEEAGQQAPPGAVLGSGESFIARARRLQAAVRGRLRGDSTQVIRADRDRHGG